MIVPRRDLPSVCADLPRLERVPQALISPLASTFRLASHPSIPPPLRPPRLSPRFHASRLETRASYPVGAGGEEGKSKRSASLLLSSAFPAPPPLLLLVHLISHRKPSKHKPILLVIVPAPSSSPLRPLAFPPALLYPPPSSLFVPKSGGHAGWRLSDGG